MVTVDDRMGSRDLLEPLIQLGVPAVSGRLESGDIEIVGNGPGGNPILLGYEYKALSEVITAIQTGRLAEQLRVMCDAYSRSTLLIYGFVRAGDEGELLTLVGREWRPAGFGKRQLNYVGFQGALSSMRVMLGVDSVIVPTKTEAAWWLRAQYHWWCCKEWEQHTTHKGLMERPVSEHTTFRPGRTPLRVYIAKELPGIGTGKLEAIEARFRTTREMIMAQEADWREIEGIGEVTAKKIVEAVGKE
jgi:ERCC4-type nuclease